MIYEIVIEADTNDADYITSISSISEEDLERFKPLIAAIAEFDGMKLNPPSYNASNWANYDHDNRYGNLDPAERYAEFGPDLISEFSDYVPNGEHGVHTITSIEYYKKPIKTKLL